MVMAMIGILTGMDVTMMMANVFVPSAFTTVQTMSTANSLAVWTRKTTSAHLIGTLSPRSGWR